MEKKRLTLKQKRVFEFIKNNLQIKPPTYRQIMRKFGFKSTQTVRDYIDALKKKEYLDKNNLPKKFGGTPVNRRENPFKSGLGLLLTPNIVGEWILVEPTTLETYENFISNSQVFLSGSNYSTSED
ncbi:MAG TPA: hypothetical protein ENH85_11580 [Candidatus Scalindua sp.]|nr:hypothetical protein [Candidatus Scalindua sp.]